ncbi:MAG: hypothetical protein VCF24_26580 [Candidatus Latescibacterota bacterium]|jgi:hypothetical protein
MAHRSLDIGSVRVHPLVQRASKHALADILIDPEAPAPDAGPMAPVLDRVATAMRVARDSGASVILCYGAHLVRNGLAPIVSRMLETGWITHLATNGAGVIHDWEYAFGGRSEEDVRANVADGTFGAWDETGRYTQLALLTGALDGMGYGESLGRFICEGGCNLPEATRLQRELEAWVRQPDGDETAPARAELLRAMSGFGWTGGWQDVPHPHATESLTAAAWHQRVPLTVHPGIGYDIVFVHPTARGAVLGRAAGIDFGVFAQAVSGLQGGVLLSVGSAVMAPQVFEKAASVANNLRLQQGQGVITPFVAVNDLAPVDWDWSKGEPPRDSPAYYLRFCKSFHRIAEEMVYAAGDNRTFLAGLWQRLRQDTR